MYYDYDVLLNFGSEEEIYPFYEWEKKDSLEFVKKIPLFRVTSETLLDHLEYQIEHSKETIELIQNKTIVKSSNSSLENAMIICDNKNALALELDTSGKVISRSKLLLSDEENLLEMLYTMKETDFHYKKGKKYQNRGELRQIEKIKKLIECELTTLYESKNFSKLKYLYYEWFNKRSTSPLKMYKEMQEELTKDYNENTQKIYNFIKMSYNK